MIAGIDYIGISINFLCHDGNGNILLHQRGIKCRDEHGVWDCGAGQLEFGENIIECALREVKEEYGCVGAVTGFVEPFSVLRKINNLDTHWIAIPFIIKINPKDVYICEVDKITNVNWFRLNNMPSNLHSALKSLLERNYQYINDIINKRE